jgi:predicted nuclease of predicted toxin-antitoxin system
MKFLLDVGISPKLGQLLEERGHTFRYLPAYFSNKMSDHEILKVAAESGEVIVTHDLDFGKLLAFSGQNQPSVILFRIHHISARIFYELLLESWEFIAEPLHIGALVVIEAELVRVRMLPI